MHVLRRTVSALLTTAVLVIAPVVAPAEADTSTTTYTPVQPRVNYGSGFWGGLVGDVKTYGDPANTDVLVVGDSITTRCYPALRTAFAAKGKTLAVIAQSGANTARLTQLLMNALALSPTVVMAAGTNDVFNPPVMARNVAKTANWTAETTSKLYWVDTYVGRAGTTLTHDIRNSGWVNGQIYAVAPNVISWNAALGSAVGRGRALSYYLQDGVHPWAAAGIGHGNGCAYWAGVIAAGVK